ncbi:DUF3265 domain-containing protein [Photobacterium angustum]|nr:DUF3265 domain-containing protein [Photobacterium angustum]
MKNKDRCRVADTYPKCSRVIRNACHFHHALVLVFKTVCCGIGIALPP